MTHNSPMTGILAVARMEFQQAMVNRLSLVFGALFVLLVAGGTYFGSKAVEAVLGEGSLITLFGQRALLANLAVALAIFGPVVPIVSSVLSIVEERSTRTIDLLLSRPVTRRGLVLGKILGRAAHITLVAVVGLVLGLLLVLDQVQPSVVDVAAFAGLTALLVTVWVSLSILLSSLVKRPTAALVAAFGMWFVFLLWGLLVQPAFNDAGLGGLPPLLNPNTLFLGAVHGYMGTMPELVERLFAAFTLGLNRAYALPALVAYLAGAVLLAIEGFHRQDEAGG